MHKRLIKTTMGLYINYVYRAVLNCAKIKSNLEIVMLQKKVIKLVLISLERKIIIKLL